MTAMMLIEFPYNAREVYKALSEEKKESFKKKFSSEFMTEYSDYARDEEGNTLKDENDKNIYVKYESVYCGNRFLIDSDQAQFLSNLGLVFEVKTFKGTLPYKVDGVEGNIGELHIHLPNYDLHSFNKVHLLEDCCTDRLQSLLDEGWRILSVCPPKSQRRPDYIMAMHDKDHKNG